jgi:signal peptidase I
MAVAVSVKKRVKPGATLVALCQLTLSGNYPTGGDTVDFKSPVGYTNRNPDMAIIQGIAGYIYQWDKANAKLLVRGGATAGTALAEFTSGAYSAALTGDTILARLEWVAVPQLPSA